MTNSDTPSPQPREDASHPPQQEPARLREALEKIEAGAKAVLVEYAYCCSGSVRYCDCVNKNHGTAVMGKNEAGDDYPIVGPAPQRGLRTMVERLREMASVRTSALFSQRKTLNEAADEIERLEKALANDRDESLWRFLNGKARELAEKLEKMHRRAQIAEGAALAALGVVDGWMGAVKHYKLRPECILLRAVKADLEKAVAKFRALSQKREG